MLQAYVCEWGTMRCLYGAARESGKDNTDFISANELPPWHLLDARLIKTRKTSYAVSRLAARNEITGYDSGYIKIEIYSPP